MGYHRCRLLPQYITPKRIFPKYGRPKYALDDFVGSVKVGGGAISNLRYPDDVVLIASSMDELQDLVNRIKESSLQFVLVLNSSKTKFMKIGKNNQSMKNADHITVSNNEIIENVKEFIYLRTLITNKL